MVTKVTKKKIISFIRTELRLSYPTPRRLLRSGGIAEADQYASRPSRFPHTNRTGGVVAARLCVVFCAGQKTEFVSVEMLYYSKASSIPG